MASAATSTALNYPYRPIHKQQHLSPPTASPPPLTREEMGWQTLKDPRTLRPTALKSKAPKPRFKLNKTQKREFGWNTSDPQDEIRIMKAILIREGLVSKLKGTMHQIRLGDHSVLSCDGNSVLTLLLQTRDSSLAVIEAMVRWFQCCGNIKRAQDSLLELSQDLMLSKRKIDNQMHLLQQSAVETEMLKLSLEEEKIATSKLDRVVKITVAELNDVNEKMRGHKKMVEDVDVERNKLQEEKRKIAFIMMDKSKTLDREIDLNEQLTKQLQSMEAELAKTTDAKTKLYAE
ncbi:hypothetical protein DYB35_012511, partial [Aphanomyces astaci]